MVLEHALAVAIDALLAEHPTLGDDFQRPREQGPVVFLAHAICHQQAVLRETLWRYRRAVRDAVTPASGPDSDDDLF
jgi:hypothetical protein